MAHEAGRMPAVFIGHGSRMNTLESNRYTEAWAELGRSLPRPRAILCVSAHWYIGYTGVTAMPKPRVIHDFFGFPDELFAFDYPAPGDPEVAEMVADVAKPRWVGLDDETWGLDHGTWSGPGAHVPRRRRAGRAAVAERDQVDRVPPRSRDPTGTAPGRGCPRRGERQRGPQPAADRPGSAGRGTVWAYRFDEQARELTATSPADVLDLMGHRDVDLAVPTPDHFLPLLYLAGLAEAEGATADVLVEGYAHGSLSMTAWTLDADCEVETTAAGPSAALPDPDVVPPEESNT